MALDTVQDMWCPDRWPKARNTDKDGQRSDQSLEQTNTEIITKKNIMNKLEAIKEFLKDLPEKQDKLNKAVLDFRRAASALSDVSEETGIPFKTDNGCYIPEAFYTILGGPFYDLDEWLEDNEIEDISDENAELVQKFFDEYGENFSYGCEYGSGYWLPSRNC